MNKKDFEKLIDGCNKSLKKGLILEDLNKMNLIVLEKMTIDYNGKFIHAKDIIDERMLSFKNPHFIKPNFYIIVHYDISTDKKIVRFKSNIDDI